MQHRRLTCRTISPLFACGFDKEKPELRASQIKGAMRYVYRIASRSPTGVLRTNERVLFGGAAGIDNSDAASPIRIQVIAPKGDEMETSQQPLLLHKNWKNSCIHSGIQHEVILRLHPILGAKIQTHFFKSESKLSTETQIQAEPKPMVDLDWYQNLLVLSLTLCGLGKRSRKGRGSIAVLEKTFQEEKDALQWICSALNQVAQISSCSGDAVYCQKGGRIVPQQPEEGADYKRPIIQKIEIGERVKGELKNFFEQVDQACHDAKGNQLYAREADQKQYKYATGFAKGGERLASPLILSLIQIKEDYFPLYTYVQSVNGMDEILDKDCVFRDRFKQAVEESTKEKGGRGSS